MRPVPGWVHGWAGWFPTCDPSWVASSVGGFRYGDSMSDVRDVLSDDARVQILNAEVAKHARGGWNVQSNSAGQAVLSKNKRIGWFWNVVLTVITGGLWLIVVIVRVVNRKKNVKVITVDAYGKVRVS